MGLRWRSRFGIKALSRRPAAKQAAPLANNQLALLLLMQGIVACKPGHVETQGHVLNGACATARQAGGAGPQAPLALDSRNLGFETFCLRCASAGTDFPMRKV